MEFEAIFMTTGCKRPQSEKNELFLFEKWHKFEQQWKHQLHAQHMNTAIIWLAAIQVHRSYA